MRLGSLSSIQRHFLFDSYYCSPATLLQIAALEGQTVGQSMSLHPVYKPKEVAPDVAAEWTRVQGKKLKSQYEVLLVVGFSSASQLMPSG